MILALVILTSPFTLAAQMIYQSLRRSPALATLELFQSLKRSPIQLVLDGHPRNATHSDGIRHLKTSARGLTVPLSYPQHGLS